MPIGCELATEGFGPKELIRQAIPAEHACLRDQRTSGPAGSEGEGS